MRLTLGIRRLLGSGHLHLAFRILFPRQSGVWKAGVSHLSEGQAVPCSLIAFTQTLELERRRIRGF